LQLDKGDPPGTLPKPCNAGSIEMEWVMENFTKSEVQQRLRRVALPTLKALLRGFGKLPAAVRRFPGKAAQYPRGVCFAFFGTLKNACKAENHYLCLTPCV
jgi:hypothetical protein